MERDRMQQAEDANTVAARMALRALWIRYYPHGPAAADRLLADQVRDQLALDAAIDAGVIGAVDAARAFRDARLKPCGCGAGACR